MSRVDELQKKYPSLPREFIVRWDVKVHANRDTRDLDEFGEWTRLVLNGTYATLDCDITLKEWVDAKPGRQKDGMILRPGKFIHPESGMLVNWYGRINTKSDLEFRHEGNSRFALYQGDERVEEVLLKPAEEQKPENFTRSGKPESEFLARNTKDSFKIAPVRHCEYFDHGVACKYCNYNMTQEDARAAGIGRSATINLEETVEAYQMFASEVRLTAGTFQMGGLLNRETEARIHTRFVEAISAAMPYKPQLRINGQPVSRQDLQRLKDVGLDKISYDMEVWDPELFEEIVPGKAKYRGRGGYLQAFEEAADILGSENVTCGFAGGVTTIPENGHKTWLEARDSMVEGFTWLIKRGIMPSTTPLWLPPGSTYGTEENRKKMPPTDYYLELSLARSELCKEYGVRHGAKLGDTPVLLPPIRK